MINSFGWFIFLVGLWLVKVCLEVKDVQAYNKKNKTDFDYLELYGEQ